jgi:serine/threonine protein kinase
MEYLELGDLEGHLESRISETEACQITEQLLEGLEFMHASNFAHRDLKPGVSNCIFPWDIDTDMTRIF